MSKLVEKLMVIRKGWNHQDFIDAYEDEWEEMPESLSDKFDKMEAHVYKIVYTMTKFRLFL